MRNIEEIIKEQLRESAEVNEEMLVIGIRDAKDRAVTLDDFVKDCVDLTRWKDNIGKTYSKYSSYNDLGGALGSLAMDEFLVLIGDLLKDGFDAEELLAGGGAISTIGVSKGSRLVYKVDIC